MDLLLIIVNFLAFITPFLITSSIVAYIVGRFVYHKKIKLKKKSRQTLMQWGLYGISVSVLLIVLLGVLTFVVLGSSF